jgi:hypothetical protein
MSQIEKVVMNPVSGQQNILPTHSNNISLSLSIPIIDNRIVDLDEAHTPLPPGVTHIKRIGTMY